jgi:hypothetical protein
MLKTLLVAAGVALGVALSGQAAEAKTRVFIGIGGFPGGYCDGYLDPYRCGGYRRFPHRYYGAPYPYGGFGGQGYLPRHVYRDPYVRDGISCRGASSILRDRGYRNVVARDCRGATYNFTARGSRGPVSVRVSAYNGSILAVRRIRY